MEGARDDLEKANEEKSDGGDDAKKQQDDQEGEENAGGQDRILIVEEGDILGRYRIPVKNNKVDFDLQLPDDSDSSNFSSDQEKDGINLGQSQQNVDGDDKTEDDKVN